VGATVSTSFRCPPGEQNMMEDVFWKRIDQWGADGLALLRTTDPSAAARINKDRLATFVMSFLFRNPNMVNNAWAKERVLNRCLKEDYAKHRRPHEPASFEEFKVALEQRGMTELAAQGLRYQVENKSIREVRLLHPASVYQRVLRGLQSRQDRHEKGDQRVGRYREVPMNKYVVEHRIDYVCGLDVSLMAFVASAAGDAATTLLLLLAGLGGIMLLGEQFEAHRLRAFIFNFEIARHRGSADV
jgi:hypothetical protein